MFSFWDYFLKSGHIFLPKRRDNFFWLDEISIFEKNKSNISLIFLKLRKYFWIFLHKLHGIAVRVLDFIHRISYFKAVLL